MGKLTKHNMMSSCSPIQIKGLDKCPEYPKMTRTERRAKERRILKAIKRGDKNIIW